VVWCGVVWCGVVWCGVLAMQTGDVGANKRKRDEDGSAAAAVAEGRDEDGREGATTARGSGVREEKGAGAVREGREGSVLENDECAGTSAAGGVNMTPASPDGGKGNELSPRVVGAYVTRESHLRKQERDGELKWEVISNDGSARSSRLLVALKNIFSKQLPNMPKEYIVRLVFDSRHYSMLCMKQGNVIGGITYRSFPKQRMAEIAFCAVSANEQVKGYGTRLMNHIKEYAKEKENMTHLITFADNNAVGYFQKQGFTKEIMMEREKWYGYIKEYDGGTIMECQLDGHVSYVDFVNQIREQRKAVEAKVREMSTAHKVYPGLKDWFKVKDNSNASSLTYPVITDPLKQIKGLREAKWEEAGIPKFRLVHPGCGDGLPTQANLNKFMRAIIAVVQAHVDSWPFAGPVNPMEVPDYYEVVKDPIDMELISERVASEKYYVSLEMFCADFRLMCNNCRIYNSPDTVYFKCANRLEAFFESKIAAGINWKIRGEPNSRG
jgi:histone acetyltransferase